MFLEFNILYYGALEKGQFYSSLKEIWKLKNNFVIRDLATQDSTVRRTLIFISLKKGINI